MIKSLLLPPIAFAIMLATAWLVSMALSRLQFRNKVAPGGTRPYACGEDISDPVESDYGSFFPFAYFFTILHVGALMLATMPGKLFSAVEIAAIYIAGLIIGLCILYRK